MDKRTIRTVNAIRETFIDMIIEKEDVLFSIKEITDRADINRKTFYLHFQCIEDLYADLEALTEKKLLEILDSKDFFQSNFKIDVLLQSILELIEQKPKLYEKLLLDDNYKFLFRNVKNKIKEKIFLMLNIDSENLKADMCAEYVFSGLIKLFRVWAKRQSEMSKNELFETAQIMIQNGLDGFSDKLEGHNLKLYS